MLIATPTTQLKSSSGLRDTATATIKANAHAFRMLSSGLYSNKIAAVLREIGCNAADAHIDAGTPDLPIEVKLPTKLNEQFYIKDFGPGLSHQQMVGSPSQPGLYLNYFDSTKQDSNTQTGAFGLGCKSPFSYTDSFVVTSAHKGVKRIYSVYVGEAGVPTISLMSESPCDSDWPHGVSVGFPVAPADIWSFAQEAQKTFKWFRISPKILGGAEIKPVTYSFDTPKFAVSNEGVELTVVMGNVHYEVDKASIGIDRYGNDISSLILNSVNLVIKADIGDVQVTPSRETLQFDDATKSYLKRVIIDAGKTLSAEFTKRTEVLLKGGWTDACALKGKISDLFHNFYNTDKILAHYGHTDKYEGMYRSGHVKVKVLDYNKANGRISTLHIPRRGTKHSVTTRQLCEGAYNRAEDWIDLIDLIENTIIVHGEPLRFAERLRLAILDKVYDQIIYFPKEADAKRLSKELYNCPMLDCTTLPLPTPKPRQKGVKKAALPTENIIIISGLALGDTTYQVDKVPKEMQYFLIDESYTTWGNQHLFRQMLGNSQSTYTWDKYWQHSRVLNEKISCPVQGYTLIKKRHIKRFEKAGWVEVSQAIKTWASSAIVTKHIQALIAPWMPIVTLKGDMSIIGQFCQIKQTNPNEYAAVQGLLSTHGIKSIIEGVYKASTDPAVLSIPKQLSEINSALEYFNLPRVSYATTETIGQLEDKILGAKPGLALVEWTSVVKHYPAHFKPLLSAHLGVS